MDTSIQVYGAKASVYLRYNGDLNSLAKIISKTLYLPAIPINPSESPPHEDYGTLEVLGCEMFLETKEIDRGFNFLLTMETEHCFKEIQSNQMHDLSLWLARFLSGIGGLDTLVVEQRVMFIKGNPEKY